jgi:hypothetical protein
MTMPFSPNTTYVDDALPAIAAQDMNDLQTYLSGLYSASKSIIGLKIDGVGNLAGPASPAQLDVRQSVLSDAAIGLFRDQLGNVRTVFDHNGYPAGRRSEYRENWDFVASVSSAITLGSFFGRWNCSNTAAGRNTIQTSPSGGTGYGGGAVLQMLFNAAVSSDRSIVYGQYPWIGPQTYTSLVMEFECSIGVAPANTNIFFGLTDMNNGAGTAPANSSPWIGLAGRSSIAPNWQMIHGDGTTLVYTDLGIAIAPTISTFIRVRIELHGTGSPFGACARLFFNDVQVGGNMTTAIPTFANLGGVGLTPQFGMVASGASNANATVGAVYLTYNRAALSSPQV